MMLQGSTAGIITLLIKTNGEGLTCAKLKFMKHLTILVPNGENNLSSIVGSYKIFTRANEYWKKNGRRELFKIDLAGISKNVEFYAGLFSVKPHTHISAITKTNLIIIPSVNHNYE